jgi:fatty acid desaturase
MRKVLHFLFLEKEFGSTKLEPNKTLLVLMGAIGFCTALLFWAPLGDVARQIVESVFFMLLLLVVILWFLTVAILHG